MRFTLNLQLTREFTLYLEHEWIHEVAAVLTPDNLLIETLARLMSEGGLQIATYQCSTGPPFRNLAPV